ncbi:MAG: hypothetical protein HY361_02545 [Candidatus Aenigmarchaeota archaeon]|nr:hypothetical protein [Candidatus Aenigmarchaeota archaeon]
MAKGISSVLIIIIVIVIGAALILSSQPQNTAKEIFNVIPTVIQAETKEVTWAGHPFEIGKLSTFQYPTSGNAGIQFTDKGFYAPSYSLPRSKLLDVNMNQKIKVKVTGNFEGQLYNMSTVNAGCGKNINYYGAKCLTTEAYHFSEICIYLVDSKETKYGIRCLGTRHNLIQGNIREHFKFDWFTVENTGKGVIVEDSSGIKLDFIDDMTTEHSISSLDKNDKWRLRINSHVNGEGWSRVEINDIEIVK